MRPAHHLIAAGAIGIPLYYTTGSLEFSAGFALSMMTIDLDHLADHCFFSKRPLKFDKLLIPGYPASYSRIVFALHSYEFVLMASAAAFWIASKLFWGIIAGWIAHLLLDEIFNRLPYNNRKINPLFYFFTFRLAKGFRVDKISRLRNYRSSLVLEGKHNE